MASAGKDGEAGLAQRALHASLWSGADSVVRAAVQFLITLVLARLLGPAQFGLLAMVLLFSGIAAVVADLGVSTALIQQQSPSADDETTAFAFNLSMSVVMAGALVLAAPWIAGFFGQPTLRGICWLMAGNLVLGAAGATQGALLAREMDFRPLLLAGLWSSVLSGALAIVLAMTGAGVWSLAWQVVAQSAIGSAYLWLHHAWRPRGRLRMDSLRRLLSFGAHVSAARLLDIAYTRLYSLFIGKLYSAGELGYYLRAQTTQQLPVNLMTGMLNRVALPAFASSAQDSTALSAGLAKSTRLLMLVNLPAMVGMGLAADDVVTTFFGPAWQASAPILRILCIAGLWWPYHTLNISALVAQGHSHLMFRIELVKKGLAVALLVAALPHGLLAIAASQAAASTLSFFINAHYSGTLLRFGAMRQLGAIARMSAACAVMGAVVMLLQSHLEAPAPLRLAVVVCAGALSYLGSCVALAEPALPEFVRLLRRAGGQANPVR